MTEIRKYQRGKHVYTRWGGQVKEVKTVPEQAKGTTASSKDTVVNVDDKNVPNTYSNASTVHHNETEFVLDFYYQHPLQKTGANLKTVLASRIISSPVHTKRLVKVLNKLVKEHEEKFGEIKEH